MSRYIFEISGEHPSIPVSEILHLLPLGNIGCTLIFGNFLMITVDMNREEMIRVSKRLAFTHYVDEYLFSSEPSKSGLLKTVSEREIPNIEGSFKVECENRSRTKGISQELEREVGAIYAGHAKVNLKNPDTEIRLLLSDDRWFVCKKLMEIDRGEYENRKADRRPFFLPISMHPRLARAMVNLSGIREGEKLLDPFCGTGGMLIEAGLVGAKILGSDVQRWIAEGCKKNLHHYGLHDFQIEVLDVGDIEVFGKVDAVVTDFPYGKASTTKKEPVESLYNRAFFAISNVLKQRGKLVCAIPSTESIKIGSEYLDLIEVHPFRVHKSLIRYICVFMKC